MIKTTTFNDQRRTKVTWQKDVSDNNTPEWNDWTFTSLMPWCFKATTAEEMVRAAHRMKFAWQPMESLTSLEDGSFLMTYKGGTLRVVVQQEALWKGQKSQEEYEEEMACMWHDWE